MRNRQWLGDARVAICGLLATASLGCDLGSGEAGGPAITALVSVAGVSGDGSSSKGTSLQDYPGIGQHAGAAVVDGLKIWITRVELMPVGEGELANVVDATDAPLELEVSTGYAGGLEEAAEVTPGTYGGVAASIQSRFAIRAWAFLDRDGDAVADTTVWTTAAGVELVDERLTDSDELVGYDYLEYPFLYVTMAESATVTTGEVAEVTTFPTPLDLTLPTGADGGADGEGDTESPQATIQVQLDTFQLPRVWDGDPDFRSEPFSWGNHYGIPNTDFFPDGVPAFGLQYLPLFAFVNEPDAVGETYAISDAETFSNGATQNFTVIFGGDGAPLAGRVRDRGGIDLNQFLWGFDEVGSGVWDIGVGDADLVSTQDPAHRQHVVVGFERLDLGSVLPLTIEDGPLCEQSAPGCLGERSAYVRRLQRND